MIQPKLARLQAEQWSRRQAQGDWSARVTQHSAIYDEVTLPLPSAAREPLLLLVDDVPVRRVWVTQLLTLAHYHVHVSETTLDAFTWCVQHGARPQVLLIGHVSPQTQFIMQRLLHWTSNGRDRSVPVVSLTQHLPEATFLSSRPSELLALGSLNILQSLWTSVRREQRR